jgi:predicted nucleic acid-binding protein
MADKIVDACSLINIYASRRLKQIISAVDGEFHISDQAKSECLTIRQPDPTDLSKLINVAIDLSETLSDGTLQLCHLDGEQEIGDYVAFAAEVDDGEASCLAIAKSRGWIVATDDQKATRIALDASIQIINTPELIQRWAAKTSASDAEITEALKNIERFASFRPRKTNPHHEWWTSRIDSI